MRKHQILRRNHLPLSLLLFRQQMCIRDSSKPLREFCGFTKVPDASKITRFKQDFGDSRKAPRPADTGNSDTGIIM